MAKYGLAGVCRDPVHDRGTLHPGRQIPEVNE
jgi:hypothetical protein